MRTILTLHVPLFLLVLHFIGDFLLQSDWMATHKSSRWDALTWHVCLYTLPFIPLVFVPAAIFAGPLFVLVTFVLHFLTDAVTSRITSKLWFFSQLPQPYERLWTVAEPNTRHWFFVMIGFDQLLHAVALGAVWQWFA